MPSTKDREGNFKDICFPTAKELRAEINTVVVEAHNNALEKMQDRKEPEKASAVGKLKEAENGKKSACEGKSGEGQGRRCPIRCFVTN